MKISAIYLNVMQSCLRNITVANYPFMDKGELKFNEIEAKQ